MTGGIDLAGDDRARIPFAVLGALLLVTSVSFAATIEQSPNGAIDTTVGDASDRLEAVESTALRGGVREAGATAAADPVVTPANTTFGAVLDEDRPFGSQLELLAYVAVAERLEGTSVDLGTARARSTLPPVTNASTAAAALNRTSVEHAGPGAVDVRIDGVERTVRQGDRVLDREQTAIEATVDTPALTLHRRTTAYESRLNGGPADPDGIGPGLSGRVNGIAMARGLAQYAGAPIEQVLAPRHVELAVNDAIRGQQRAAFGAADDRLQRGLTRRGAAMVQGAVTQHSKRVNGSVALRAPNAPKGPAFQEDVRPDWFKQEREPQPTTVRVGPHAGTALDRLLVGEDGPSLSAVIADVYSADVRADHAAAVVASEQVDTPDRPGADWDLVDTEESIRVTDVDTANAGTAPPALPPDWRRVETVRRRASVERTIVRTYERGTERNRTVERRRETHAVAISIGIRVGHSEYAPERSATGFDATGAFDDVETSAVEAYYERAGSPELLTRRAVRDGALPNETVETDPPAELESELRSELWGLREDVAGESVTVDRTRIATSENPHSELVAAVEANRSAYVRAPATYSNPAQKARVAARAAYVDRLMGELRTSADAVDDGQSAIDLAARVSTSVGDAPVDDVLVAGTDVATPSAGAVDGAPPVDTLELTVESDPAYLASDGVDAEYVRTADRRHYPIAIRTINVVSLPTGRIADAVGDAVGDALFGPAETVDLTTAAQSLAAVESVPPEARTETLESHRTALRSEVNSGLETVQADAAAGLGSATDLDEADRIAAVQAGFRRWETLDARVHAANNGSAASAVADEVVAHPSTPSSPRYRERVELRVATAINDSLAAADAQVPEGPITDALDGARGRTSDAVANVTERGLDRGAEKLSSRLRSGKARVPLGVPVAPPYAWVATVNGWTVEVEGEYATFAVRSNRGGPGNAPVTYQRHGREVRVDVTGDGSPERLGTADRVSFSTWTTAIVAVPPGKSGVGNTDGRMVLETSAWPEPGFEASGDERRAGPRPASDCGRTNQSRASGCRSSGDRHRSD